MKLRRIFLLVAAGVIALSTTVVGAGPAAAATPNSLCVVYGADYPDYCAFPNGSSPVSMKWVGSGMTTAVWGDWLYNGLYHPGQIQQVDTGLCMQLNHAAGNLVIEAPCNGASYQKWEAIPGYGGGLEFYSLWDATQCLTFNKDHGYLDTVACNGASYQSFVPHPNML